MTQRVARKEAGRLYSRLNAGEESEVPGLLEQWLREGKMSEEEALNESVGMFLAGVDTVIIILIVLMIYTNSIRQQTKVYFCSMLLPSIQRCRRSCMLK